MTPCEIELKVNALIAVLEKRVCTVDYDCRPWDYILWDEEEEAELFQEFERILSQ